MADNFGFKLGIEGEKEFKNALKDINSAFKVLGSEMTLVSSQFDKNDKSQEAVTARSKVLRKEIEAQEEKIKMLEAALENASESFGENDRRTQSWTAQLNNAKADLNKLNSELKDTESALDDTADEFDDAEKQADQFADELDRTGKEADSASSKLDKLGSVAKGIGAAMGTALAAVGTAAVSAGKKLTELAVDSAAFADEILTTATVTGISAEQLQAYTYAAELVDVSTETMTKSMAKNIKSMDSAVQGSKLYVQAYEKLGVSVTDANGNMRDSETVYWECIDALGKLENETERDAIAMQIFGKSAQQLNPLIAQGSAGMKELTEEAKNMGAVMSEETLEKLGAFDDSVQRLKSGASAAKNVLGTVLLPELQFLADGGVSLLGEFTKGMNEAGGDWSKISDVIGNTLGKATDLLLEAIPKVTAIVQEILMALLTAIAENLPSILESGTSIVFSLLSGLTSVLPQVAECAVTLILTLAEGLLSNLPSILEAAIQVVLTLATGIGEALPELIPSVISTVVTIVTVLLENMDLILEAAFLLIEGLATGLLEALPVLIESLPTLIESILSFVTSNLPKLLEMGIKLTVQLGLGLIKAIPKLVAQIPQIISAIVSSLANGVGSLANVGKNLLEGLWSGLQNAKNWLVQKIRNLGSVVTDALKTVLGIHSPSRVFRDEIGANLALGLGEGFEQTMKGVTEDMKHQVPTNFDLETTLTGVSKIVTEPVLSNTMPSSKGISINLNIDKFINNGVEDIQQLADEISVAIAASVRRKGVAF